MPNVELIVILIGLFIVASLYSSVGHGGASGYLAVLSLTSYGLIGASWLKQHVWFLNLIVAAIAFYHYRKAGYHYNKLSLPFIVASVPFAVIGGYLKVSGELYDYLLSIALIWAAYRLIALKGNNEMVGVRAPEVKVALPIGGGIGLVSGIVGVGGGIFLSPIILLKKWGSPKAVAATSALFIWVNSLAGIVGHGLSGQLDLDFEILSLFVLVVLVGGYIGSRYAALIAPQRQVRNLLAFVLVIAAARRVLEIFGI